MNRRRRGVYQILIILCVVSGAQAQSPHGKTFNIRCEACHTSQSWAVTNDSISFDHDSTSFLLEGQHRIIDCRQCHTNLEFSKAETSCVSCHIDIHQQTVGQECARCHNSSSWLVNNIAEIHRQISFPLLGAHAVANCSECHKSETNLRFEQTGTECIACHLNDFNATTNPDHKKEGFSTECITCHKFDAFEWTAEGFNHDFFPLRDGHAINECATCHKGAVYSAISAECITCHETDYKNTTNPNHQTANITTSCADCHSLQPGWKPADFKQHDLQYFPIYSGSHRGEWDKCTDCHTDPGNYSDFTCITCHKNPETDNKHQGIFGYSYHSSSCLACHPDGRAEGAFNHDNTNFQLTGAHTTVECLSCHSAGFSGTPTTCFACHATDFNESTNPSHPGLGLSTDCIACHTTAPDWNPATFAVHNDYYVLSGAHSAIANQCATCHQGDYNSTPSTCVGCHQQDFNQSTDPQHLALRFPTDCTTCHSENSWKPSTFDHNNVYLLTGAHATISNQCVSCHQGGLTNTPTTCAGCHLQDFNQTTDPSHSTLQISTDCASCHSENSWAPSTFNHNNVYVLAGAHAIIADQCVSCHQNGVSNTPTACVGCHQQDYDQTSDPSHTLLQFSTDCATCHNENAWVPASFDHDEKYFPIYSGSHKGEWNACIDCHNTPGNFNQYTCITCHSNPETNNHHNGIAGYAYNSPACFACHPDGKAEGAFDHNTTGFQLTGAHTSLECLSCHANGFSGTPTECQACHLQDFNQTINPNHQSLGFSTECITCHTTEPGWSPVTFSNHNDYYPLSGAHAVIATQCASCHNGDYNNTPNTCAGCHLTDYNQTTDPPHITLQFSQDCATCHNENAWIPSSFDHDEQYFPIYSGAHQGVWNQCSECHTTPGNYALFTCITCHTNPETDQSHQGVGGYVYNSTACLACHPNGQGDFGFDHNTTNFPLTGAHLMVNCLECHSNGFQGTPTECAACHSIDYNQSINPNHIGLALPTDCGSCHTTAPDWNPATFDIHNQYYVLEGAHALIANQCITCHNGDYNNTPNTCVGCHQGDYNQTTNPSHTTIQLSTECVSCHTESTWAPANFPNHNDFYVLAGAHAVIASECVLCHNGDYNNTPNTCVGCHLDDYNATNNPSHITLGFGTDCVNCHSENAWQPANFDHDDQYFPIYSGAHQGAWDQCIDCHTNPNDFSVFTCITCHTNPETNQQHQGVNGYAYNSVLCLACHPTGSTMGMFDHNNTNFPLTGSHTIVDCLDCHTNGFQGTPTDCNACHMTDFNQSINPNHVTLNIPTDCAMCHTTVPDWNPATFDIHNQYYALEGAHALIANQCATCHNGNYNNTPNTCVGCHQGDYNQTNNPSHVALNFTTDCITCHTQTAWTPAEFTDHDDAYFPIYSGGHQGAWSQCSDCHTNPNNYSVYTCITCHTNPETNQQHVGVNGYTYQNFACLACHPTGDVAGSFDHNQSNFPLTGAHVTVNCLDCHANGFQGTPTNCDACHIPDYNQSTNPNHISLAIPTQCVTCHTTTPDWTPALFPIHDDYYPLLGAHAAISGQCVVCHNGNYNNTPNTCVGCHQDDYNQTNDPNHQAAQFPTTCETCHSQNAWTPANWNHDDLYFPIYSGHHHNEWDQCSDCHTNPNDYSVFTCITCHQQGPTNNDHQGVGGYQYNSAACYNCHPDGNAD